MLTIHHSNRLDALAAELAAVTRAPLATPFSTEVVVVQSRGVARWLALTLADTAGVCANVRFPFPTAFAWALYRAVAEDIPEQSPYAPDVLAWRILGLLPGLEATAPFEAVRAYVRGDALRRAQLASRLAALYDEYLVYRPDWVAAWERGEASHWQGKLWQRLARDIATPHRATLHAQLIKALAKGKLAPGALPERVSVFGAPALPPALIELFGALGRVSEVHLFVQNPCREFWGDIRDPASIAKKTLAGEPEAPYLESGNRLLASLGKQGRDFFDLLASVEGDRVEQHDAFVEPGNGTLLASIQSELLDLTERSGDAPRAAAPQADRSLQVHSCHSAMREVEVLHDQLLALFEAHRDLHPSDVVVMTPDIETYAPYIEAVFGTAAPRIPFSLSDRSAEKSSTLAATLMDLLALPGSRYEAHRVLGVLDEPAVRRRYALSEADIESVRRWVADSQIRWGIDAAHRARFGVPAVHEHTWRFGLTRLALGYALPAYGERLFADVLPYDEVEGSLGVVLGRFASFTEAAITLDSKLAEPRSIARWCQALQEALADFFDPPEERAEELETVRSAIAAIDADARLAGFGDAVPLTVVLSVLRDRLEAPGRAFLSGGVTFCAMVPMRSLPFEIVCMIGMNDRAYPRVRRRDGFDLMASEFRKGDRSRRDDDRYLFLESIVNAGRCVYVSYTGRHIREDTVMPPSVLVSELLDYVAHGYEGEGRTDIRRQLVTEHPLQAFSPRYFKGGDRLFSYSEPLARAAAGAGRGTRASEPLLGAALPPLGFEERTIDLDELVRFFRNPVRRLFESRLKVRLETAEEELESREPFELGGLPLYKLKERLLDLTLREEAHDGLALARAGGVLPPGRLGEVLFEAQSAIVERVAERASGLMPDALLDPHAFELASERLTLAGTLSRMSAEGMLIYRVAKASANVRVAAWIRHLALNAYAPRGVAKVSRCIAQDALLTYSPVENARERLLELLDLYWTGMQRPLKFFPRTACEYGKQGEINYKVRSVWTGGYPDYRGEANDPYFALAFRGAEPLDDEFEALANTVFGAMTPALKEEAIA
ncbi:MAG TPA: exodeoxyribonuclease V subunit gamma [Burkholderiales bacterium]|nr:exodeoxyribonuclease V subunit gamma [Burkholderiales bacterium]